MPHRDHRLRGEHFLLKGRFILTYLFSNQILIPAAVRRASLYLVAARRSVANAGAIGIFPKEIVKMIAIKVWETRKDPIWIEALLELERTGEHFATNNVVIP